MFNWKLIVTVIILLGIVAFFAYTQPSVQGFFVSVKDKIFSFMGRTEERNISFSLVAEYSNISFKDSVNMTIQPVLFSADIRYMNIRTSDTIAMDFSGSGMIEKNSLRLDGVTNNIEIGNSSIALNEASVVSNCTFNSLVIENLELKELMLTDGFLTVKGTETEFSDTIEISNLEGRFEFSDKLRIEGLAGRILIPEADMVID
jgi:hypothetical protein